MNEKLTIKPDLHIQVLKDLFSNWKKFLNREQAINVMQSVIDNVYGNGEPNGQS